MLLGSHLRKNPIEIRDLQKPFKNRNHIEYDQNPYNENVFQECCYVLSTYDDSSLFSLNLNSLSINLFREYVTDRLAILHFIDAKSKLEDNNTRTLTDSTNRSLLEKLLSEKGFKLFDSLTPINKTSPSHLENCWRKDLLSHFLLKLCFINNKEKQEWFIEQEIKLLLFKLSTIINSNLFTQKRDNIKSNKSFIIEKLLKMYGVNYPIWNFDQIKNQNNTNDSEFHQLQKLWEDAVSVITNGHLIKRLFKIPFWPDGFRFIKNRKYFIKDGICFIPDTEIESLFIYKYKKELINSFINLKENEILLEKTILSDQRVSSLIREVSEFYFTSNDFRGGGLLSSSSFNSLSENQAFENFKLDTSNIYQVYLSSFPLCMRHLFESLKKDHHLKHWSRLQLWLFLKGCGMKLEEQLSLWKSLWTDANSFDKEIKYNIRHAYGQEGKRSNYSPYPCNKIINGLPLPGNGQNHGCPFKTFDNYPLQKLLQTYYGHIIPNEDIKNITQLSKSGHYQLSCVQLFKSLHLKSDSEGIGNHPNSYFKKSIQNHIIIEHNKNN
ncbi:Eukaryotic and archaeal DNA primase large subunit family protein [Cryptosporidium meleagridis]|uniref:Eukaryotic and archaeal DNA primase large subunit family protein n=1 Tax=Cryptosporidium meleagridis TaxID=93969 RepID=A0A2P4Z4W6_9CRYT|nr:Eukaryotic and archaeal DNA primase large subunit family protein [Cryptosporidium meleagridis]